MIKRTVSKIKQYQRKIFCVVLVFVLICLQSSGVYADESEEFVALHGGRLFSFESFYLELVAQDGEISLFVTDHENNVVSTKSGHAEIIILNDKEKSKTSVSLIPDQENSLRGTGEFLIESNTTLTVFVKLFGKNAHVARLIPSGRVFNILDIPNINSFCNYYYINRGSQHHQDFLYIYHVFCHLYDSKHRQNYRVQSSQDLYDDGAEEYEEDEEDEEYEEGERKPNPIHQKHHYDKSRDQIDEHTHDYHLHEDDNGHHEYDNYDHHEEEGEGHEDEDDEDEDEDEEDEDEEDEEE